MKKKIGLIFFLLIIWVLIIGVIFFLAKDIFKKRDKDVTYKVKESITVESGDALPSYKDYFEDDAPDEASVDYYHKGVKVTDRKNYFFYEEHYKGYTMGTFEIDVEIHAKQVYKSKLIIEDHTNPEVKLKELTVKSYTPYEAKEFIDKYTDNSNLNDFTVEFTTDTYEEVGKYEVGLEICDTSDNCIQETAKLEIIPGDTKIGDYKLSYGRYTGEICDENVDIKYCDDSTIYVLGDKIKLNDGSLKKYIVDKNNLILSNGEVFKVIDDNKLEYQNSLKPIYTFVEEA